LSRPVAFDISRVANSKYEGKSNKLWKHLHNVSGCENHGTAMTLNDCDGEQIINPKYIADIFIIKFFDISDISVGIKIHIFSDIYKMIIEDICNIFWIYNLLTITII
jgi:hypothetical protein